jgi:CRISPR-associated exonuclease Cas4
MWWPGGDDQAGRIPLSALEHFAYCPRQAALIHVDGVFTDNLDTARGTIAHQQVHSPSPTPRKDLPGGRLVTALPVWSDRLHLYGICDAVEISRTTAAPIEHKIGSYREGGPADVQVGAQAICLREMLGIDVPTGYVFSHADRRRHTVPITEGLVARVEAIAAETRAALTGDVLPPAVNDRRCPGCSLRHDCLPGLVAEPPRRDLFTARPLGAWDD